MIKKKQSHLPLANFLLRDVHVVDPYSGKDLSQDLAIKEGLVTDASRAGDLPEINASGIRSELPKRRQGDDKHIDHRLLPLRMIPVPSYLH